MPGEELEDALGAAVSFAEGGLGTVFTNLGERIDSLAGAAAVRDHYLHVLDAIAERQLPTHVSVKLTHLGMSIDREACIQSVITLARKAEQTGSFVWIDMEESPYVDDTLAVFRSARAASEKVGICLQSYLRRTPQDVESLLPIRPAIRLVKGAYREPESIAYPKKSDTDRAYLELATRMVGADGCFPVFGTHDMRLLNEIARRGGRFEAHMLYGIKSADQRALAARGVAVRVLISYGANWYPWYVRRLAERPANVWFVVRNLWS